jgi:SAM-dependent methyltransferase
MTWDPIWEKIFSNSGWGRYPNEELIRFMARHFYHAKARKDVRILEIGCGNGANLWYLAKEGFDAVGIDGSKTAVEMARNRLAEEGQSARLVAGDVANIGNIFGAAEFDAIVDIGCLQCNLYEDVRGIVAQCERVLRPGGRMFALIVTSGSWGDQTGREIAPGTYADIPEGPLKNRGVNHFFSRPEIDHLWQAFSERRVEYVARSFENGSKEYRTWTVDAALGR